MASATVENSMGVPKKLKSELPYNPVVPLLDIYPKKMKILIRKDMHPYAQCSIIYKSQDIEAT